MDLSAEMANDDYERTGGLDEGNEDEGLNLNDKIQIVVFILTIAVVLLIMMYALSLFSDTLIGKDIGNTVNIILH